MPLWRIYHPPGTFESADERQAISKDVTAVYTAVPLPAFYVVVLFVPLEEHAIFVGGESKSSQNTPFIRIEIDNIARRLPEGANEHKTRFLNRVDAALKPYIADKGWDWEYHVEETDRSLWKINGMIPPQPRSEEEKMWIEKNKPVEYEGAYPPK